MIRIASIALLALLLAGCASRGPASIAGGECRIFERPQYEVRGKQPYDQDWIDSQVEGGVGGCHWKRPSRRPAELDAAPGARPPAVKPARRGILRRIRDRVLPHKVEAPAAAPLEPAPAPVNAVPPPVIAAPPPGIPAPRPPRSAIDRLLDPHDDD